MFDEMYEALAPILGDEWELEGTFGPLDDNLIHIPCGTMVEPDAEECPVCHVPNPLREAGLI